jgi:aspartate carbamoyltransferase regulatory subunit
MNVDSIKNGFVIDHIPAGKGMELYNLLGLGELDCQIAMIRNAPSRIMGKKDIIKIDADIDISLDVIGFFDPNITVNTIKDEKLISKSHLELPESLENVCKCKNPRCITSTEQELNHIFRLTDRQNKVYRCLYCDSKLKSYF